jgi:hypothetical protein
VNIISQEAFFAQKGMEQHISLIIEGTTEKVLQNVMLLRSIYNKNLGFTEQKKYFSTLQRDSNKKKSNN